MTARRRRRRRRIMLNSAESAPAAVFPWPCFRCGNTATGLFRVRKLLRVPGAAPPLADSESARPAGQPARPGRSVSDKWPRARRFAGANRRKAVPLATPDATRRGSRGRSSRRMRERFPTQERAPVNLGRPAWVPGSRCEQGPPAALARAAGPRKMQARAAGGRRGGGGRVGGGAGRRPVPRRLEELVTARRSGRRRRPPPSFVNENICRLRFTN